MKTASDTAPSILSVAARFPWRCLTGNGILAIQMAATGEREDPAFPVGAACRIDSRSPWRHVAEIPVGLDPEGIAVDVDTHEVVREISTGDEPIDIGLDQQTGRVFTADAHSDQVTIIDSATLEVETAVPVGGYPSGLTHVPEFRRLYVGNSLGSTMSVIDLDTLETVA